MNAKSPHVPATPQLEARVESVTIAKLEKKIATPHLNKNLNERRSANMSKNNKDNDFFMLDLEFKYNEETDSLEYIGPTKNFERIKMSQNLRTLIEAKFKFKEALRANEGIEQMKLGVAVDSAYIRAARVEHSQMKQEILPVLLECVEALKDIVDAPGDDSFLIARQALASLHKWAESK